jgi:malate dehydrogenase (oxaloacetate-decarboxylating)(NADP+)
MKKMGIADYQNIEIANAAISKHVDEYIDYLYPRLQRSGYLYRDVARMVKNDRNIFASCMLQLGHGDAMITGITRNYNVSLENITRVIDPNPGDTLFGLSMVVAKGRTLFFSDTTVLELPEADELAHIAAKTAEMARQMGHEPRVALLSYSTFGNPMGERSERLRETIRHLDEMKVDFEYDGEMSASVALNPELMALYPFCRLTGPANVLVMPGLHSAHISAQLLQELGDGVTVGPVTMGLSRPAQIVQMNATVSEILNLAVLAAMKAFTDQQAKVSPIAKPVRKKAKA